MNRREGLSSWCVMNTLLVGLSFASGSLDALSYLLLGHVFVAFMTGNMVLLGLALGRVETTAALYSLTALGGFCLGVAASSLTARRQGAERPWPPAMSFNVALEGVLLTVLAVLWTAVALSPGPFVFLLIGAAAVAMGLQSASVLRLGIAGVSTTFATGTLAAAVSRLVALTVPAATSLPTRSQGGGPGLLLPAAVLGAYGLGAVAGGGGALAWSARAAWIPAAMVILVALVDMATRAAAARRSRYEGMSTPNDGAPG